MRTKTLLAAAATLAVSLATSMAQVYSQNIVGYINLTLKPGFNLVANQLDVSGGTNTLMSVLPAGNLPDGTLLYKFNSGTFSVDYCLANAIQGYPVGWYDNTTFNPSTTKVGPGEGFFVNLPGTTNVTVTLVGSVRTGTNTVVLNSGFSLVSSVTPESYELTGTNFPGYEGTLYYTFNAGTFTTLYYLQNAIQGYPVGWYDNTTFSPATAKPAVGEGFFINLPPAAGTVNWTRVFTP